MLGQLNDGVKQFLAGNIAGWGAITVSQPLDYIRTQLQINYKIPSFYDIFKKIGFFGFYRGASSLYITIGLTTYIEFTLYQNLMRKLNQISKQTAQNQINLINVLISGLVVGSVAALLYTPIQYAKIRSQVKKSQTTTGSARRIFQILKDERFSGFKRLMTGVQWTLIRQVPGSGIYYVSYNFFLHRVFLQSRNQSSVFSNIFCGGISGVIYQIYIYPLDVIKTNIQSGKRQYSQLIKSKFWKAQSFKVGFGISICRSFVVDAANWSIYQNARKSLGLTNKLTLV